MDKLFLQLANENFYSSSEAMRNFFMLGMDEKAFLTEGNENKHSIITQGIEHNTITISGMMLREQSWITDMGYGTSTEEVISHIHSTLGEGKKVKLNMNTGGGLVSGTSNLAEVIYENRENIEAYATGMVASAGMWVFASAGKRFAESTTVLGSIGVVTSVVDDEKYWENHGIVWKEIVSDNAKNKRPDVKTESGQAEVKRYLTALEEVFIDSVSTSLGMTKEQVVTNFHQGGLITGKNALDLKVIDALVGYNNKTVAVMPSSADTAKIAKSNKKEDTMSIEKITAENGKLIEANDKLDLANSTLTTDLATANKKITDMSVEHESEIGAMKEAGANIIGMAFEHNVSKDTAIAMYATGDIDKSATVALNSKTLGGATVVAGDIDKSVTDEEQEMAYAIDVAKQYNKNK